MRGLSFLSIVLVMSLVLSSCGNGFIDISFNGDSKGSKTESPTVSIDDLIEEYNI